MHFAFFVSPHGFGHAARASALMSALHRRLRDAKFSVFTRTPRWFFDESLPFSFEYVDCASDVGLVQATALDIDLAATERVLAECLPFQAQRVQALAAELRHRGCTAVVCDIAPLGIAAAHAAGLPSALVENFTWDWIYQPYFDHAPGLKAAAKVMAHWFVKADIHVQAEPVCRHNPGADMVVAPICRSLRNDSVTVRASLGVGRQSKLVVVTQGGMTQPLAFLDRLRARRDVHFLVTGLDRTFVEDNLHGYDNRTIIYMPDLVAAADVVVGKLGYSIVAETWQGGALFAYVPREDFRESATLQHFVEREMPNIRIERTEFEDGAWLRRLDEVLALTRGTPRLTSGAAEAAAVLARLGL